MTNSEKWTRETEKTGNGVKKEKKAAEKTSKNQKWTD